MNYLKTFKYKLLKNKFIMDKSNKIYKLFI